MVHDADYTPTLDEMDAVLAFLPVFEREDFSPAEPKAPPGHLPYHAFSEELFDFLEALYEGGFVYPFAWLRWQDKARRYYEEPERLEQANLQTLRKLLTVHVRKDRFFDGHLPAMVESGHITRILRRLHAIRERRR